MNKKTILIIILVALLVVVVAFGRNWWKKEIGNFFSSPAATSTSSVGSQLPTSSVKTIPRSRPSKLTATPAPGLAAPLSYTESLNKYRTLGAYIQLLSCHGVPGTLAIKRGVDFMLDNQDTIAHTIAIGSVMSRQLPARGFVVTHAPNQDGQYYITCDGGGAALLTVDR